MIGIYFDSKDINHILDSILLFDDEIVPIWFNDREHVNTDNRIDDGKKFISFQEENRGGYFLFSRSCKYDFTITHEKEESTIFVDFSHDFLWEEFVEKIFLFLDQYIVFGFSCEYEDYRYRNRVYTELNGSIIESWVGRDLSKYIPGLYWRTVISKKLINTHNVPIALLYNECLSVTELKHTYFVSMFDKPNQWKEYSDRIDDFCSHLHGFFSIKDAKKLVEKTGNYIQFSGIISEWK